MKLDETEWDDHAWVPKLELNQYFTKEYYDIFINAVRLR